MGVEEKIRQRLRSAMLEREREEVEALRFLLSLIQKEEALKGRLSENEKIRILKGELKKKKEALEYFVKSKREKLIQKEKKEIALLESFLPKQLGEKALRKLIKEVVAQNPTLNFGQLMGKIMAQVGSQAEGKEVARILQSEIGKEQA